MELILAYLAGLLTLINPCVLPVLPIVLATALNADRRGPTALALGMSIAFVGFGMLIAVSGRSLGLTPAGLSDAGAMVMIGFGLILLIAPLARGFERAMAGVAARADRHIDAQDHRTLMGQFIGGILLGVVWSPCIGPTLGGAIALASQGEALVWSFLIMVCFAAGVSSLIIGICMGGQSLIRRRATALRGLAEKSKPVLGLVFIGVGLMILTRMHHRLEIWAIENLPYWFQDLSVAL